jgi:hypothetical protein
VDRTNVLVSAIHKWYFLQYNCENKSSFTNTQVTNPPQPVTIFVSCCLLCFVLASLPCSQYPSMGSHPKLD